MKKIASILAVVVLTIGMASCESDTASNDEFYDTVDVMASDKDKADGSGGSGGQ